MNSSSSLGLQGVGEKCNFFFISFEPFPLEEIYYVSPIDDNLNLKSLSSNIFLGKKLILESMSSIEFCPVNPLLQVFLLCVWKCIYIVDFQWQCICILDDQEHCINRRCCVCTIPSTFYNPPSEKSTQQIKTTNKYNRTQQTKIKSDTQTQCPV